MATSNAMPKMPRIEDFPKRKLDSMVGPEHPEAVAFVNRYHELTDANGRMFQQIEKHIVDLNSAHAQLAETLKQLYEARRRADEYQQAYLTMRAELSVLTSGLTSFTSVCTAALEKSRMELVRANVDPDQPTGENMPADEQTVRDLGKRLGADAAPKV